MSSSGAIDFSAGLGELDAIDSAMERLKKNEANASPPKPKPAPKESATKSEGQGGGDAPKQKASPTKQAAKKAPVNDPWVNATYKVRDSKKTRLGRLSLQRKLDGVSPHTLQEMLDEAFDFVLNKYEAKR